MVPILDTINLTKEVLTMTETTKKDLEEIVKIAPNAQKIFINGELDGSSSSSLEVDLVYEDGLDNVECIMNSMEVYNYLFDKHEVLQDEYDFFVFAIVNDLSAPLKDVKLVYDKNDGSVKDVVFV